jgi:RNA polymerase sigma factor (sigma-70 family)
MGARAAVAVKGKALRKGKSRRFNHENTPSEADKIVCGNTRLVHKVAQKYRHLADYDELVAEGNIGLVIAAQRFNPKLGNAFSTFAYPWIRARMLLLVENEQNNPLALACLTSARRNLYRRKSQGLADAVARVAAAGHVSLSDDASECVADSSTDVDEQVCRHLVSERARSRIVRALRRLPDRERLIIRYRYLTNKPATLSELGEWFDLSRERIRQLEQAALKALRLLLREELAEAWL